MVMGMLKTRFYWQKSSNPTGVVVYEGDLYFSEIDKIVLQI